MEFIKDLQNTDPHFNLKQIEPIFQLFDLNLVNQFYLFLKEKSQTIGFFSHSDQDRIAYRHIFECMVYIYYIYSHNNVSRETSVLDVGSGPGLPGFLFYCLKNKPLISLLDSSQKRLKQVESYCKTKQFYDIQFIYKRIEEWNQLYDIITIRALIPFPFSARLVRHCVKKRLYIFAGKVDMNEKIKIYLQQSGYENIHIYPIKELKNLGIRNLIVLFSKKSSKNLIPVKWKTIRREMEKWATL